MHFEEKTISKESIYKGKIIEVEKHKVSLPNNKTAYREVVKHNGAVAICALTPDQQVILVKQYRKALEQELLEIPAGKLEPGEDRESAAMRELEEETGYKAKKLTLIGEVYGTPGFSNEKISVYFADNLVEGKVNLDEDEFVEKVLYSLDDVKKAVEARTIEDAKTFIAFQHLLLHYNHSK
ncbi:NUDIX domain-containing protein [Staphylococcus pseudintermedius]|uniref:NUDIX hydrolase n=1 Tax=Staphylococcus pseudintermedius TaxID=283734 RepID=UPI000C1B86D0|nr:NUDIX hydrolase [Staphylococcus pseudintermedius]EGQ1274692.1 NUDIX domain-containing protein [Staphylococcus pseudintermedius]EGQ1279281.1 NUDIX domain-containing protein [Staphylococcus pseudintermedius]EGQ1296404.1 NUDIX domain-containing protein [Staphylococcus pseudintermedius]EGQ1312106.1 NUDIX domain-containing protein [Staphylococcus pseudintermedius]EGQ1710686.1 NUDIX hydrolase [Staphylococcus pseudintermedius]